MPERLNFSQIQKGDEAPRAMTDQEVQNHKDKLEKKLSFSQMDPAVLRHLKSEPKKDLSREEKRKNFVLRDSIHFKTNIEYIKYLQSCLAEVGLTPELYDQFKVLFYSNNDAEAMEGVWRHLKDIDYSDSEIMLEKADGLRQMDRMEEAFEILNQAVNRFPAEAPVIYALVMYYKLEKDYESAEHWIKKWKQLEPTNPEVYYHLGTVYKRVGSIGLARTNLLECLAFDSSHLAAKSLLEKLEN